MTCGRGGPAPSLLRVHIAVWFFAALFATTVEARAGGRPNVLVVCADDLATHAVGAWGATAARTPHLDRFARTCTTFLRAYANSPVCTASRQSLLTGRYPRSIGVTRLQTPLGEAAVTLAEMLAPSGYHAHALGKMHFNSDRLHGFAAHEDMPHYRRWLAAQTRAPLPEGIETLGPWRPFKDPAAVWLNSRVLPYPALAAEMSAAFFVDRAIEFLAESRTQPFLLWVSLYEPHSPFHFPADWADRRDPGEFTAPEVIDADRWQIPRIFRDLTDEQKRGIAAAYHTSVAFLDSQVGRLLDALSASSHAQNTLVVFLSDHGYLLGQHGRFEKHCSFEEAVRTPLAICLPQNEGTTARTTGQTSEAIVELVDVVPTILELCGISIPREMQGKSLARLLRGETDVHRDYAISEYAENEEAMIRDARWKLVFTAGQRERQDGYAADPPSGPRVRLYDTQADPGELVDLSAESEHAQRVKELLSRLASHVRGTLGESVRKGAQSLDERGVLIRFLGAPDPPSPN